MKNALRFFLSVYLIAFSCFVLTGCFSSPPDVETVETQFKDNYEDIQLVVDFIIGTDYQSIQINTTDGTMWADFETVEILDDAVNGAVERLLGRSFMDEGKYHFIYKSGHTIYLPQWSSSQDIGCGVAYSINETDLPRIQYCTELMPLIEKGWYYYVDDYNSWRTGKRP